MSTRYAITIICDVCGKEGMTATTATAARRKLHEEYGWMRTDAKDLCPGCHKATRRAYAPRRQRVLA